MAIQGINPYSQYSSVYKKSPIDGVESTPASAVNAQQDVATSTSDNGNHGQESQANFDLEVNKAPKNSNPSDFTFDFKKNNNFNLVAATNDTEDINVSKELDAMKKDSVLEQYKFFVGPTNLGTDQDGTVRLK